MCANTQSAFIKRIARCEKQINKQRQTSLRETAGFDFRAKAFNNTILFHAVSSAGTCGGVTAIAADSKILPLKLPRKFGYSQKSVQSKGADFCFSLVSFGGFQYTITYSKRSYAREV